MNEKQLLRSVALLAMMVLLKSLLWAMAPAPDSLAADSLFEGWTPPVAAMKKNLKVGSYRARLAGDVLVIEVAHESGWHTYALDNLERAKKRAGEAPLGIEKATQIEVSGGLKVTGKWRQSPPRDLSQTEINWFTWGFEGIAHFAVKVERTGSAGDAVIIINGQACKATTCAMIDDLEIRLPIPSRDEAVAQFDLSILIELGDISDVHK